MIQKIFTQQQKDHPSTKFRKASENAIVSFDSIVIRGHIDLGSWSMVISFHNLVILESSSVPRLSSGHLPSGPFLSLILCQAMVVVDATLCFLLNSQTPNSAKKKWNIWTVLNTKFPNTLLQPKNSCPPLPLLVLISLCWLWLGILTLRGWLLIT